MGRRADDGKRVEWIQRLRRRDTSGLTVATFCEWEGVSVAAFVTVLHDYIRGVGVPRQWRRVTERRLTLRFVFSGSPADAEPGSIGVGRRHHAVLRSGECVRIRGGAFSRHPLAAINNPWSLETAHSLPPESAGSRSPERRDEGIDAVPTGSAQAFFACGVLILLNCRHTLCCTAEWWVRECAGEAGWSRRPRQWRVSGTSSTRFHQTEMVRPAVGAATTVRWSVR